MPSLPPELLAHRYDPGADAVHLHRVDRARRHASPFLTDADLKLAAPEAVMRRADALAMARGDGTRAAFVFHSAFCCSTLLANAYERPGRALSLKEPMLLQDLVGWRQRGGPPAEVGARLADGLALLARPFEAGEVAVIKPSNVVNGLAAAMLDARPEAGALLLHAPLGLFLNSIARKGLWGRRWVRDLLSKLLTDGNVDLGFAPADYFLLTDLQVAAVGWLAQHALFARLAKAWPERVRTLDSEVLLARPAEALAALDRLFGVADDDRGRAAVVAAEFRRNAKFGERFSAADRAAQQGSAAALHGEELELVLKWAGAVAANAGVALDLPQPLLG